MPTLDMFFLAGYLEIAKAFSTCDHFLCAEKGICISTASLWILLVYTEASLRLKDLKTSHANLSHLFAAHWCVDFTCITLS